MSSVDRIASLVLYGMSNTKNAYIPKRIKVVIRIFFNVLDIVFRLFIHLIPYTIAK